MRTPAQAVAVVEAYAAHHIPVHPGWCDHYVATYYGLAYSGYSTAISHYHAIPSQYRHGLSEPPPGALCFYSGGSQGAGHIDLSVGAWNCGSTDYPRTGYVGIAPIKKIAADWHLTYLGWTDAYYGPQGTVLVHPVLPPPPPPAPLPPAKEGNSVFMYLKADKSRAVLVEGGKSYLLSDSNLANQFSTAGAVYIKETTPAQEAWFVSRFGTPLP